jgi:hypothetical protein
MIKYGPVSSRGITFGYHNRRWISWPAMELLISLEGLYWIQVYNPELVQHSFHCLRTKSEMHRALHVRDTPQPDTSSSSKIIFTLSSIIFLQAMLPSVFRVNLNSIPFFKSICLFSEINCHSADCSMYLVTISVDHICNRAYLLVPQKWRSI